MHDLEKSDSAVVCAGQRPDEDRIVRSQHLRFGHHLHGRMGGFRLPGAGPQRGRHPTATIISAGWSQTHCANLQGPAAIARLDRIALRVTAARTMDRVTRASACVKEHNIKSDS
jgi:hypothetical protein